MKKVFLFLLLGFGFAGCDTKNPTDKTVQVWVSTANGKKQLTQEENVLFQVNKDKEPAYIITVQDDITYQKWIGCGACTNDASSWLMFKHLSTAAKDSLMLRLFDKKVGIGMDWVRHQMACGDAGVINGGWYTYDDMPKGETDPELAHFSIDMERDYILPTLKQALQINPNLKIVGSPWTPPGWMKTSADDPNPLNHGEVQPKYYDAFTNYFVKFIQAYQKEGIPVYGVTLQNEPMAPVQSWAAAGMTGEVQRELIKNHFIPAFKKNGIDTKIYIFDHDWDLGWEFLATVYGDPEVYDFVAGSAWHHYGGLPGIMTRVHEKYPDKEIWFTEGDANIYGYHMRYNYQSYRGSFLSFAYNMIHIQRNWSQAMMMYQIALDPDHGPAAVNTPAMNYGMVTINPKDSSITYRPEYFTLGHVSKFVYPDAYRIESDQYEGDIESLAFKNPDGSIALVLSSARHDKTVRVKWGAQSFDYKVPGQSMVTFTWNP